MIWFHIILMIWEISTGISLLVLLADTSIAWLSLIFERIVLSVFFPTSNLQGCCYKELLSKN